MKCPNEVICHYDSRKKQNKEFESSGSSSHCFCINTKVQIHKVEFLEEEEVDVDFQDSMRSRIGNYFLLLFCIQFPIWSSSMHMKHFTNFYILLQASCIGVIQSTTTSENNAWGFPNSLMFIMHQYCNCFFLFKDEKGGIQYHFPFIFHSASTTFL